MRRTLVLLTVALVCHQTMIAQIVRTHVSGGATPYALSTDYQAIGFNPALMTGSLWSSNALGTSGSFEGGVKVSSNALSQPDLWGQLFERQDTEAGSLDGERWLDALANEELGVQASLTTLGMARKIGRWSIGYVNRRSLQASIDLGNGLAELVTNGGLGLYDDVLVDGLVTSTASLGAGWDGEWTGFAMDSTLNQSALLEGTSLRIQSVRTHDLAISKCWGDPMEGWQLHTGVTGRLILGNAMFDLDAMGGQATAFSATSGGFSLATMQNLDSLFTRGFTPSIQRLVQPAGKGWGSDAGIALTKGERLLITAAVTDLGRMEWRGTAYDTEEVMLSPDLFGASDMAVDADGWLDGAVDFLTADAWFLGGKDTVMVQRMAPTYALGAAFRPWSPLVLAGNVTGTHMDAFGNDGMGWGLTMGLQVLQSLFLETGIVQNRNESRTMPLALRLVTKGGWEMGLRMDDVSSLWQESHAALSGQWCFMRWNVGAL